MSFKTDNHGTFLVCTYIRQQQFFKVFTSEYLMHYTRTLPHYSLYTLNTFNFYIHTHPNYTTFILENNRLNLKKKLGKLPILLANFFNTSPSFQFIFHVVSEPCLRGDTFISLMQLRQDPST